MNRVFAVRKLGMVVCAGAEKLRCYLVPNTYSRRKLAPKVWGYSFPNRYDENVFGLWSTGHYLKTGTVPILFTHNSDFYHRRIASSWTVSSGASVTDKYKIICNKVKLTASVGAFSLRMSDILRLNITDDVAQSVNQPWRNWIGPRDPHDIRFVFPSLLPSLPPFYLKFLKATSFSCRGFVSHNLAVNYT